MTELYDNMMEQFHELQRTVRNYNGHLYERWKAGGFLLDNTFVSMYPNLADIVEEMQDASDNPKD